MAKLTYSMLVSLDGYTEDANGDFGWGAPADEALLTAINELAASVGTYLYGRKIYETMVYWETATQNPEHSPADLAFARQWQAAEKVVFSRTLDAPSSARTRIERDFDPEAIRRLKATASHDLTIDGPTLAAQALKAGLVDEIHPIVCPVIIGGGKRFLPTDLRLDLRLLNERKFESGVVLLQYAVC